MKKKIAILAAVAAMALFSVITFADETTPIAPDDPTGPTYYQTMRYCSGRLTYACTTKVLAESCRRYACLTSY